MKFYIYIIHSPSIDKYYIGISSNLTERIKKHNTNHKGYTGKVNDWTLVHQEEFDNKSDALKREKQIKSWKSKKAIQKLIDSSKI